MNKAEIKLALTEDENAEIQVRGNAMDLFFLFSSVLEGDEDLKAVLLAAVSYYFDDKEDEFNAFILAREQAKKEIARQEKAKTNRTDIN